MPSLARSKFPDGPCAGNHAQMSGLKFSSAVAGFGVLMLLFSVGFVCGCSGACDSMLFSSVQASKIWLSSCFARC